MVNAIGPTTEQGMIIDFTEDSEVGAEAREISRHQSVITGHFPGREADDLVAVCLDALASDRPDNRIKTGAVTASSQHADTHVDSPFPLVARMDRRQPGTTG